MTGTTDTLLASNLQSVDSAEALLERETLDAEEVDLILAGKPLPPLKKEPLPPPTSPPEEKKPVVQEEAAPQPPLGVFPKKGLAH